MEFLCPSYYGNRLMPNNAQISIWFNSFSANQILFHFNANKVARTGVALYVCE